MLSRIDLRSVPKERVQRAIQASRVLNNYSPPAIAGAPNAIAKLKGYQDFQAMNERFQNHKFMRSSLVGSRDYSVSDNAQFLLTNPDNYEFETMGIFRPIDITLQLIFGDQKDLAGAQLGSSYAPFLLFLREIRELNGIVGVDIDPAASQYAKSLGVEVLLHDARKLPFTDSSLDFIFTHHFLDPAYCSIIDSAYGLDPRNREAVFLRDVLKEVHRVLKPNGVHIMCNEYPTYYPGQNTYLAPFRMAHFYPSEFLEASSMLDYIAVLQKTD